MANIPTPEDISRRLRPVRADDLSAANDDNAAPRSSDLPDIPLPPGLAHRIDQRADAQACFAGDHTPEPGKIVALHSVSGDESSAVAIEPIPVVLDILESGGKTWRGWIVSRDRDYASSWDLILGPEEVDIDPLCEMAQAWNPVRVAIPVKVRILGKLSTERLAALRMLAVDHENGFISGPPGEHRLGVILARELSDGTGVVTGTALGSDDDPRVEYQRIYRKVADKLAAPVQAAPVRKVAFERPSFLQRLFGLPAWQLGGAITMLLLAPLVVMMVMQEPPLQEQIAVGPPGSIDYDQTRSYAGTGEAQQLRVTDPEAAAQEIVEALRQIGAFPETRTSWAGGVSIRADLSRIPAAEREKTLSRFKIQLPQDGILRVDVLKRDLLQGDTSSKVLQSDPSKQ